MSVRKLREIFLNKFTKIRKIKENCEKSSRKYCRILKQNSTVILDKKNLKTWKILEKFVENLKIFYEIVKYYEEFLRDFESICIKKFEENIKDFRNIIKVVETF